MYEIYHKKFSNEVYSATGNYLFWLNLQNQPAGDKKLLDSLNVTPTSWIFIRHSLMVSLIMTLGRIFDTNGESFSIDDLLKSCIENIHSFNKSSLRERKIKDTGGKEADWLEEFIDNAYEPNELDFQKLKPQVKKHRETFNGIYKPIRHNIFAHTTKEHFGKTSEIWESTSKSNIEEILDFLTDLNLTLRETYHNGRKPVLSGAKMEKGFFEKDISLLLQRVKNA
ncbi:MAG: hypothetical protein HOG49_39285 [Candidatus Scalindua sp.]|nr:hypothetical protein [Candidatus Scalindua sp.]